MLGRTANGLYWMYRYLERAENTARLIATGQRLSLTRGSAADEQWDSVILTTGTGAAYAARVSGSDQDSAVNWMLRDPENPSSVLSSIVSARQNGRMVRTALTTEVWEAMNSCYMAARDALARKVPERDLPGVLGMIRERTALVRGATHGTMLRNDYYDFARVGTFLERADNTARILDVKYYVLLPSAFAVGSNLDNVQWESILRSVSARGGFRTLYGQDNRPRNIAEFLILDKRMPRSLNFCCGKIRDNLGYLASDYGLRLPCHRQAETLTRRYMSHDIDAIFDYGLHEFIQDMLGELAALGRQIEVDYRFYE